MCAAVVCGGLRDGGLVCRQGAGDGTQGVNEVVAGLVGQGLTILETLRQAAPASAITGANGSGGDTNRDKYRQFSQ
jgi:hypothetical protein